jgi:hypothetical protein
MIEDADFGIEKANCYRLIRTCEMYQWVETRTETVVGDQSFTAYTYELEWCDRRIDSLTFRNRSKVNPNKEWPYESKNIKAEEIHISGFVLNQ